MEISDIASMATTMSATRVAGEVGMRVMKQAMDAGSTAVLGLVQALEQSVPAGLTYSPNGLSAASSSRVIASL